MTDLQATNNGEIISSVVLNGDLSRMTPDMKVSYYKQFCESLGLNPLTQPFQIISFQGKQRLYATKDCTEQLRKIHGVSVVDMQKDFNNELGIYVVTCKVQDKHGKTDIATGAVSVKGLAGDALCNALLKSETKSKRRATLSICGLGMLDESETDTIGKFEAYPVEQAPAMLSAEKETDIFNQIAEMGEDDLDAFCKKIAGENAANADFISKLRTAYKARKEQLAFIAEMGGTPDQRGLEDETDYADIRGK